MAILKQGGSVNIAIESAATYYIKTTGEARYRHEKGSQYLPFISFDSSTTIEFSEFGQNEKLYIEAISGRVEYSTTAFATNDIIESPADVTFEELNDRVNGSAGTAATLISQHNSDASAHPELSAFITSEADRAEAAADAATLNGKIFDTVALGVAGTVNDDYFSVVSSNDEGYLDLYKNESSSAVYQKTYPSSAATDGIEDKLYSSIEIPIAGELPTSNSTTSNNVTWVESKPIDFDCRINKVSVDIAAENTLLTIKVFERVGNTFTAKSKLPLGNQTTAGVKTFDVSLNVSAGDYIGYYADKGISSALKPSDGYYLVGNNKDSFEDSTISIAHERLSILFEGVKLKSDINTEEIESLKTNVSSNKLDINTLKDEVLYDKFFVGALDQLSGVDNLPQGNWLVDVPSENSFTLTKFVHPSVTVAGEIYKVRVYSKVGDVFKVEREFQFTTVVGVNDVSFGMEVNAGEYVGCYVTNNTSTFNNASSNFVRYFYGSGDLGVGGEFTDTQSSSFKLPMQWYFRGSEIENLDKRVNVLEQATQSTGLPFDYNMILGCGQSLMEGSWTSLDLPIQQPITLTQEYDSLGFKGAVNDGLIYPATVANTQIGNRGEWSGLGCATYLKELLAKNKGIPTQSSGNTVVITNEGFGGAKISEINKGGIRGRFELGISKAEDLSSLTSQNSGAIAVNFMQGESDVGTDKTNYLSDLIQLASDYNEDLKAATGQSLGVNMYTYQLSTYRNVAITQAEAALDNTNIVTASPMYQFDYYDSLHIGAQGERLIGAYFAQAIYQTVVNGVKFEALKPVSTVLVGNTITMTFNKSGLVLDDTLIPMQTNYGFGVFDGTTEKTITSVKVVNSNQIRLTLSEPAQLDWVVKYGSPVVNKTPQVGVCGNLRDSNGDNNKFDGFPLHNWCLIFDYTL